MYPVDTKQGGVANTPKGCAAIQLRGTLRCSKG